MGRFQNWLRRFQNVVRRFQNVVGNPVNNPETNELIFDPNIVKYAIRQLEKSSEGTPHLQGLFLTTKRIKRGTASKVLNNKVHLEPVKNLTASLNYVTKTETRVQGPWTFGTKPEIKTLKINNNCSDEQSEIKMIDGLIDEGKTFIDIYRIIPELARKHKDYIDRRISQLTHETRNKLQVLVITGPPGTGKTNLAESFCSSLRRSRYHKDETKWWPGYSDI